ncbi:hypothetical protein GIB67_012269 [Kingdonia uniflora]|uniref:AB hydrolase-1 domain-containing protein n=1 Tax=Kingdonia uniflora TaxID=39325 RepID=A0A7J7LFU2_9MAGN|nr:hypothetical protein GIB67_012269 [Kingdonia uniflora]
MVTSGLGVIPLLRRFQRRTFTLAGLSFQSIQVDLQTLVYFWGPQTGFITGKPTVVVISTFGAPTIRQWHSQVPYFASYYNLYIPDLVFVGKSISTSLDRTDVFQAQCVAKLLEKIGLERYSIVGHSYGSLVGYHMARLWPERVDKVVIASCAVNLNHKDHLDLMELVGVETIEDLLVPRTAKSLKLLYAVTMRNRPYIPKFVLNELLHVSSVSLSFINLHLLMKEYYEIH